MSGRSVAIVGATGAVGQELLRVLEARGTAIASVRPLASPRSAGQRVAFGGEELEVRPLGPGAFEGVDVALFAAGASVSRRHVPEAVAAGAVVIDNSSAFRMDPDVPLVVPECNAETIAAHRGIIANPNCSTIILVLALAPLHAAAGLRRVVVSTYQAVSGAGQRAIHELHAATRAALDGERPGAEVLPHPVAFNVFPHIDAFGPDGYTREEDKMLFETRKILGVPELALEATCVRVPVERSHCEAVTVELARPLAPGAARALFAAAAGLVVEDDPAAAVVPQPIDVAGCDAVAVGRVRESRAFAHGLTFWLAGDQLRKGAALNAVQILENL